LIPHTPPEPEPNLRAPSRDRFALLLAQGLGTGRVPIAPGTAGSVLGVAWFLLLVVPGIFWLYLAGMTVGVLASVRLCGRAEMLLGHKDPGSVVLDEIVAVPLSYLSWVVVAWLQHGECSLRALAAAGSLPWLLIVGFVAFRLFDALKPWPIRPLQQVQGGWGIVMDDLAAALCATAVLLWFTNAFSVSA
jgi:phosphatidylglycerophosphatase A